MEPFAVYKDIQARTHGQFLVGVVGPVRTGKSTFVRRFMELLALPGMDEQDRREVHGSFPYPVQGKPLPQWNQIYPQRSSGCSFGRRYSGKGPFDRLCGIYGSGRFRKYGK